MANYSRATSSNVQSRSNGAYDPFSILASASSPSASTSNSRSMTPAGSTRPANASSSSANDAFSSLLGASFATSANSSNMSLAERRKAAQTENQIRAAQVSVQCEKEASVWSGLDMMGMGQSNAMQSSSKSPPIPSSDDWIFDKLQSQPKTTASSQAQAPKQASSVLDDDWGLGDLVAAPSSGKSPATTSSLFDSLDDSGSILDTFGSSISGSTPQHVAELEDDDVLGLLGKPVESVQKPPPNRTQIPPEAREHKQPQSRAASPPPHIIGQIVEMGFTPQQARLALASTDTGLDVQQALDTLLANGVGSSDTVDGTDEERPRRGLADFRDEDGYEEDTNRRESSRQRPQVSRQISSSGRPNADRPLTQSPSLLPDDMQERADKLLAQASTIGLNMFNKANALWKDGRDKVQKAYDERAGKAKGPSDGRPKWMTEAIGDDDAQHIGGRNGGGSRFEDDDEGPSRSPLTERRPQKTATQTSVSAPQPRKAINLFGDDEPATYVSPARRRPAPPTSTSQPKPTSSSSVPRASVPQPTLRTRQAVAANAGAIVASNQQKAKGTELFKLGQYANAEQAYTAAMTALPSNHLLMIPLYNNRAIARIKTGEHAAAVEDCSAAIAIIGTGYHPTKEAKVAREDEGSSVDLADALIKAYRRRAEAHEGREKWDLALKDWEAIIACDWSARMRNDALAGAGRCRKMINGERSIPQAKAAVQPPRPKPKPSVNPQNFAAVRELKAANAAQEKEEQLKMDLKDSVEARLLAWKGGKETNVRALVASLDTVLWSDLGWQKVGLHELITPGQVKIRYMKAIAKLHPDKLATSTTTEQRMIANGVFGALNDAWVAFKQ